jgi:uncharacterized membrane protein
MQNQDATAIRHVDTNRGVEWVSAGFNLFMKKPGELVIAGLILFVISFAMNFVPLIGSALATMAGVVAAGAFMRASEAIENGQDPLAAAQAAAGVAPLFILGLIAAGMGLAVGLISAAMITLAVGAAFFSPFAGLGIAAVTWLLMMFISIPMIMALWLAPGLVLMRGTAPLDAVRLSFMASLQNLLPFIIFYVIAAIACFLGALMMGVGLIVVYPVLLCAAYFAYKDMFGPVGGEGVSLIKDAS